MPAVTALEPVNRELQQMEVTMIRGLRQRLPEELTATFYASGARLLVPGRKPVEGPDAIAQFWRSMFSAGLIDVRMESQRVDAEHELAYGSGTYLATFETQPGMLRSDHGTYLTVYRRQADGNWRAVEQSLSLDWPISVP
ncbi:MAG: nuclear transport factor 2 family protein [Bryobacterales bacterium]|nr:nuclear transport factor 2 family protein [Bryobacterales bacterium]